MGKFIKSKEYKDKREGCPTGLEPATARTTTESYHQLSYGHHDLLSTLTLAHVHS